jgi:hypothetical protein
MAEVKTMFGQVGETGDIVGQYFGSIYKNYSGQMNVEVQNFDGKNVRVTLLKVDNRTKAFVIENRTEFNNEEFIYGCVD